MHSVIVTLALISLASAPLFAEESQVELPRNAQRAIDRYTTITEQADVELAETIDEARAEHAKITTSARAALTAALERSINSRTSVADQAAVYRLLLTYDRNNETAKSFFSTLGTLEQTLAAIEKEHPIDFLGAFIEPSSSAAGASASASVPSGSLKEVLLGNEWFRIKYGMGATFTEEGKVIRHNGKGSLSYSIKGESVTIVNTGKSRTYTFDPKGGKLVTEAGEIGYRITP